MNMLFEFPFGFAALAAVPLLLAIYLLRNRFRQFYVSSLMLWGIQRRHKQGGLNLDRLQTPLLFILELMIFLLLAMAAAGPLLRSKSDTRRIVVVLDDSFSMLAKADTTCRQAAVEDLKRYFKVSGPFQVSFIRAGLSPTVLARDVDNMAQVSSVLDRWQCFSPTADLDKALTLAGEMTDQKARILIISDHPPQGLEGETQFEYRTFGRPLTNVGFLYAERTRTGDQDRCILTIGNFSNTPAMVNLTIQSLDGGTRLYEKQIDIQPTEPYQMIFEPPGKVDLVASINDDALAIDNRVILLNPDYQQVRVAVDLASSRLAESITNVLDVIDAARQANQTPHLLITDKSLPDTVDVLPWTLQIQSDPNSAAFVGPFIIDRNHPLTDGLDLQGVIWSASRGRGLHSLPVISAGNTSLLEDRQDNHDAHHIVLYLNPEQSTLQQSPNWPIFFWNLVHWRQQALPGLNRFNWRLGSQVIFEVPPFASEFQLVRPDGQTEKYDNPDNKIVIEADAPGFYRLTAENETYAFAVNAISADESDLRACRTQQRDNPDQAVQFWWEYRAYDGLLLLVAIILLALHGVAVFRQSKGGGV